MKWRKIAGVSAILFLVSTAALAVLKQFKTPTVNSQPREIVRGPDGNMWFTESNVGQIARVNASGKITEFVVPTRGTQPSEIVAGVDDGALWFTEISGPIIGRVTTAGVFTEFPFPGSVPQGIAFGLDRNLWITDQQGLIWRMTPAGAFASFAIPTPDSNPIGITLGPDGNMWFAEFNTNLIGRITPNGIIDEFGPATGGPQRVTVGRDGNLWFTEPFANLIGRITPTGTITGEFPIPTANAFPADIVGGTDGNLYFTEFNAGQVAQITTAGVITEVQKVRNGPFGIGSDLVSGIWITELNGDRVSVFQVGP